MILVIVFVAIFVRGVFGFGDNLVAIPLLTLFLTLQTAVPLVAAIGFLAAVPIVWHYRHSVNLHAMRRMLIGALFGIPAGLLLLVRLPEDTIIAILGTSLIIYSIYMLWGKVIGFLKQQVWGYPAGFLSGAFGSAYAIVGPPIVVYSSAQEWSAAEFKGTIVAYFAVTELLIIGGHLIAGLWNLDLLLTFLWCIPVLWMAVYLGQKLGDRLPTAQFINYVYINVIFHN